MSSRVESSTGYIQDLTDIFTAALPPDITPENKAIMMESFVNDILEDKSSSNLLGVSKYIPTVPEMLFNGSAQSEKNILSVSLLKNLGYENCFLTFGFPFGSYPHFWTTLEIEGKRFELGTPDYDSKHKMFKIDDRKIYWIRSPGKTFSSALFMDYPVKGLFTTVIIVLLLSGFSSIYWEGNLKKKAMKLGTLLVLVIFFSLILFAVFNLYVFHQPEISESDCSVEIYRQGRRTACGTGKNRYGPGLENA